MSWVRRVGLCLLLILAGWMIERGAWLTFHEGVSRSIVTEALAQVGCVPNPNNSGPPFVNGCPITAAGLNVLANAVGIGLPQVATNAALTALTGSFNSVTRLGFTSAGDSPQVMYALQNSPCSLNSGAGDNGSQVPTAGGGKCWIANLNGIEVTPMIWGAAGNGTTDDTVPVQAAINAAQTAAVPLRLDATHLFKITSTLNITSNLDFEGQYRYGAWSTNGTNGTRSCAWGLTTTSNITLLNITAVTGTFKNLCLQLGASTGNGVSASAGAAMAFAPPSVSTYQSGLTVEFNTIINPFDGITINGSGYNAACCGIGTTADGNLFAWNTIINPADVGISSGKNTAGAATVGNTLLDNNINCINTTSRASGTGIALYDGSIWYDGTENGPLFCNVGFLVAPGTVSSVAQSATLNADGVFGDQSGTHDLWIKPTTGGVVNFVTVGGKGPWAAATSNVTSVLIDCTAASSSCEEFNFTGLTVHGGAGQTVPIFSVVAGVGGPYDLSIVGSNICEFGTPGGGAVALKLDLSSASATSAGRFVISGNRLGTGCPGTAVATGIQLITGSANTGNVTITNNDISAATSAISYTPQTTDTVILNNNMGIDDNLGVVASGATITLGAAWPNFQITGTTTISTINGAWWGRQAKLSAGASASITTNTAGNICAPALSAVQATTLTWFPGATCWSHVP